MDAAAVREVASAVDGTFEEGPFEGRTVNIRWYPKREGIVDLAKNGPETYLVMTGPKASTTRNIERPLLVHAVYLFDADDLRSRGVRMATAASVRQELWDAAEIYPRSHPRLVLTGEQKRLLAEFGR